MDGRTTARSWNAEPPLRAARWLALSDLRRRAALGATVLAGWFARSAAVVQLAPGLIPMQPDTALGILAGALAVIAAALGRPRWAGAAGVVVLLLGGLSAIGYATGSGPSFDVLFAPRFVPPAKMAPNTAVGLLLAGLGLVLAPAWRGRGARTVSALSGAVAGGFGLVALLGYGAGLPAAYGWGQLTPMAPATALCLLLLGTGLVTEVWVRAVVRLAGMPVWAPWTVALAGTAVSVVLGYALWRAQQEDLSALTERRVERLGSELRDDLGTYFVPLAHLPRPADGSPTAARLADLYLTDLPGWDSIAWLDLDGRVLAERSPSFAALDPAEMVRRAGVEKLVADAHRRGTTRLGAVWSAETPYLVVVVPSPTGTLVALFRATDVLGASLRHEVSGQYVALTVGERMLYERPGSEAPEGRRRPHRAPVEIAGARWTILLGRPSRTAEEGVFLPWTVGLSGTLMSFLLALALRRGRAARKHEAEARVALVALTVASAERDRAARELQLFFDLSPDLFAIVGFDGRLQQLNRAWKDVLGYPVRDLLAGRPAIADLVPEEDRVERAEFLDRLHRGADETASFEGRFRARDGSYRWLSGNSRAVPAVQVVYTVARDITARKRFELELERSNRELEQFAYVASHDLQEPLRMVASYVELLGRRYRGRLDADADDFIGYAAEGARRMQQLIEDLLAYSRVQTRGREPEPVAVNEVVEEAVDRLRHAIAESGAEITWEGLPEVRGDGGQLVQLFQNLLANALKFRGAEPPRVEVRAARSRWGMGVLRARQRHRHRPRVLRAHLRHLPAPQRPSASTPAPASAWRWSSGSSSATAAVSGSSRRRARERPSTSPCRRSTRRRHERRTEDCAIEHPAGGGQCRRCPADPRGPPRGQGRQPAGGRRRRRDGARLPLPARPARRRDPTRPGAARPQSAAEGRPRGAGRDQARSRPPADPRGRADHLEGRGGRDAQLRPARQLLHHQTGRARRVPRSGARHRRVLARRGQAAPATGRGTEVPLGRRSRLRALLVEDNPGDQRLVREMLRDAGGADEVDLALAGSLAEALAQLTAASFEVGLLDLSLPDAQGLRAFEELRAAAPHLPLVVVTGFADEELAREAARHGAQDYLVKGAFDGRILLRSIRYSIERHRLVTELEDTNVDTIRRLVLASEHKDRDTAGHIQRIGEYCAVIAGAAGLPASEVELLRQASRMHDVGKIGVPDAILLKPGPLTPLERRTMERHTVVGARILHGSPSRLLQAGEVIALTHHERWDGEGYPRRLSGEAIPLWGRICAVADVFDALTTDRPYRGALAVDRTLGMMAEDRGRHFDPELFDLFERHLDEILDIRTTFRPLLGPSRRQADAAGPTAGTPYDGEPAAPFDASPRNNRPLSIG